MKRAKDPEDLIRGIRSDIWEEEPELESVLSLVLDDLVQGRIGSRDDLQRSKVSHSKKFRIVSIPTNSMLLDMLHKRHPDKVDEFLPLLRKKPSRTLSGVAVVAVMTSPSPCPHGKCIFCPGGADQEVPTPQSYTGHEPAAMRAQMNDFDPYRQTSNRIDQLEMIGHPADKIDLILMGGTITARPLQYQLEFVKGCLDGMNGNISSTMEEAQRKNELSDHRCIGMTFETRPDRLNSEEVDMVLALGGTRVELGVQSTFDEPLIISGRGHCVDETIEATRIAKDSGLKVGYHMMPGLPGSSIEDDERSILKALYESDFMPDMIKIYPTLVVEGTGLHEMWLSGEYEPLGTRNAAELVARIKEKTPPWVRIQRVQRDIPTPHIREGVKKSNLRQIAQGIMKEKGGTCRCIRCREIGHRSRYRSEIPSPDDIKLKIREYDASEGKEIFLSFEAEDETLIGYSRLRIPSPEFHREELEDSILLRELKVFGPMVPIGKEMKDRWQHMGFGTRLIELSEEIARDRFQMSRLTITSGIGAREYYRKFGYERLGPYMSRSLR